VIVGVGECVTVGVLLGNSVGVGSGVSVGNSQVSMLLQPASATRRHAPSNVRKTRIPDFTVSGAA